MQARVDRLLKQKSLDGLVLIDYVGANVRLGRKLRRQCPQLPISYYIAPQEWAWRFGDGSSTELLGFTDRILAIFPAEAEFYSGRGAEVTWVGHPLLDVYQHLPDRRESRQALGLDPQAPVLLLLPASRPQELTYLMPALARAAALIQQGHPSLQVLVPAGLADFEQPCNGRWRLRGCDRPGSFLRTGRWIEETLGAAADLALGKSGTVNLELALQGTPGGGVPGESTHRRHRQISSRIQRCAYLAGDLLLNERLVPELLQDELTAEALVDQALPLLVNGPQRQRMLDGYGRLRETLGAPGVTERAAGHP